jgi:hypothetical protein
VSTSVTEARERQVGRRGLAGRCPGAAGRGGAAPRSNGGAGAAQHPSPGPYRKGQRGRVCGELAGRRSNQAASQLRLALAPAAFVVVSGATEVVPLTAYLTAADRLPDAALLVPKPGSGILANLAAHPAVFGFGGRMVVWVRDLPRYLSDDSGLDLMVLSQFLGRSQPTVVLATISDVDLEALGSGTPGPPDATRALLDQAVLIPVPAAAAPAPEDAIPTAARSAPLAAFLSYVRSDDEYDNGGITKSRERLDKELRILTDENNATFQGRNDIAWGQNWSERVNEALNAATVLIVIITPSLFRSAACRA